MKRDNYIYIREGFFRKKLGHFLFTDKKFQEFKLKINKLRNYALFRSISNNSRSIFT